MAGAIYFLLVSIAHFLEIKIPVLFIYFDVKSFQYQNKIISLLAFGWSSYFFIGTKIINTKQIKYILYLIISGVYAIIVLSVINLSKELQKLIDTTSLLKYWIATIALIIYLLILIFLYIKVRKEVNNE